MLRALGPGLRRLSIISTRWESWSMTDAQCTSHVHLLAPAIVRHCPLLAHLTIEDLRPRCAAEVLLQCHFLQRTAMDPCLWWSVSIRFAEVDTAGNAKQATPTVPASVIGQEVCTTCTLHRAVPGLHCACRGVHAATLGALWLCVIAFSDSPAPHLLTGANVHRLVRRSQCWRMNPKLSRLDLSVDFVDYTEYHHASVITGACAFTVGSPPNAGLLHPDMMQAGLVRCTR